MGFLARLAHGSMKHGWMFVLVTTLALNIYLLKERQAFAPPEVPGLDVGDPIASVELSALGSSAPVRVDFAGRRRPTLIYALSPTCGWCWRNEPNLAALRSCTSDDYNLLIVALHTRGLTEYFANAVCVLPLC